MLSRREESLIRGLRRRRIRERENLYLAEGPHVVEELLATGTALDLVLASSSFEDSSKGAELLRRVSEQCTVRIVDDAAFTDLAVTRSPRGILAVVRLRRHDLAELEVSGAAAVLVVDGVQDPGNLGTIIRTADALGVAWTAALSGTVDPWNPKVVRAAAGSLFRMPLVQPELEEMLEWLRGRGFVILGADAEGEPLEGPPPGQRIALAVGNEGAGLSPGVEEVMDEMVSIPIRGEVESLNVSVAAGILLFQITRHL